MDLLIKAANLSS